MKITERHVPIPPQIRTVPELLIYLGRLQLRGQYADLGSAEGLSGNTPSIRLVDMEM